LNIYNGAKDISSATIANYILCAFRKQVGLIYLKEMNTRRYLSKLELLQKEEGFRTMKGSDTPRTKLCRISAPYRNKEKFLI